MSIMRWAGGRSTLASFIEVTLFFCALSVAFFVLCFGVYHMIAQPMAKVRQAERLGQALDESLNSATVMVDARREMLNKEQLARELLGKRDQARAAAEAEPTDQQAAELVRQSDQQAAEAENQARRAKRLADQAAEEAQTTIRNAALLMVAEPSEAAGKLATIAGQVAESAKAMDETADQAVKMTSPPEEQPAEQAGPSGQLGGSFVHLVETIDALHALTDRYVALADAGAKTKVAALAKASEQAAVRAVRSAAGAIFDDDIESIAKTTGLAARTIVADNLRISPKDGEIAVQIVVDAAKKATEAMKALASGRGCEDSVCALVEAARQGATAAEAREDIIAIADATTDAVTTSRDSVGRIQQEDIPIIVEAVEEAVTTALDDVEGTTEEDITAIAQVAELAVRQAVAAAEEDAIPTGQAGQTPGWADQLIERFVDDRLKAEQTLTASLPEIIEAVRAVESAAIDVITAARTAREDVPNAQWSREADEFIKLVDQIEAAASNLVGEAKAIGEEIAAGQPQDQANQADLAATITTAATALIADAKAIADNPPANTWAGQEELIALIDQIEQTLQPVITSAEALTGETDAPPDGEEAATEPAPPADDAAAETTPADGSGAAQPSPASLAVKLQNAAERVVAQCHSARQAIEEKRTAQTKEMVNMVRRIEDRAKRTIRRSRRALRIAEAAGRPQVTPGQSTSESISQGLGEVRMGRLFRSGFPPIDFAQLFGSLPWWMWVAEGLIYLLFLTIYWAPSDDTAMNVCELRAFVLFAVVAVVLTLVALQMQGQYLSKPIRLFFETLQQGG